MTGPEHYKEAERYLSVLDLEKDPDGWLAAMANGEVSAAMAAAQVHATLALAAATALNHSDGEGLHSHEWETWDKAAGTQVKPPEVTP